MEKVIFVFPGQGSQKVGMGKELYEKYETAKKLYDSANEILGFDIKTLSFEGPADELTKTENSQPAIFLNSIVVFEILKDKGIEPSAVAGHSLGEYTALTSAGVFSFEDGLKLVRQRGLIMAEADPEKKGTMAAVIGIDGNKVKSICQEVSKTAYVEAVNFNEPMQTVISGTKEGVEKASEMLKEAGVKRVVPLKVSGAFHSKLMEPAAEKLKAYLETIKINPPSVKVYSNVTAQPYPPEPEAVIDLLVKQLTSPVMWIDEVKNMVNDTGSKKFIEVGESRVLQGLIKKIISEVEFLNTADLI